MRTKSASTSNSLAARNANLVGVIVETPRGNRSKLKYDPARRLFKLSKVLPEGMVDPLFPGCLVECMLIGAIEAEQEEEGKNKRNDRLIAVAAVASLF